MFVFRNIWRAWWYSCNTRLKIRSLALLPTKSSFQRLAVTFATFAFLHLGNSDHVVVCVFIEFPISSKNNILFIAQFLVLLC